jgi:trans-2,3-dihydro-3-hydroxyanthranilate isomerase
MDGNLPCHLVDAFTAQRFRGNRAGVVLAADTLKPEQMQSLAAEVGASETAFLSRLNDLHQPVRLRWFTPTQEVDFCGHATLAAAHVLSTVGIWPPDSAPTDATLLFETNAGTLTLFSEKEATPDATAWWLAMPPGAVTRDTSRHKPLLEALGLQPDELVDNLAPMRTRDQDVILLVKQFRRLVELQPDHSRLAAWSRQFGVRGVLVSTTQTLSPSVAAQSRFFAPAAGVPEDPVTGSVHGPLGLLLVAHGLVPFERGRAVLDCVQAIPDGRAGLVRLLITEENGAKSVALGGACITTLRGEITL